MSKDKVFTGSKTIKQNTEMKITNYIYALIMLGIFVCCGKNNETTIFETITLKNEYIDLSKCLDFEFVPLETTKDNLIGIISNIKMTEDRIFIFDSYKANALFVFDKKGKYITRIGSPGMGPGEFAHLAGFDIDVINNNIIIYDFKRKFMYYDLNTYKLITEKSMDISCCDFIILPQDEYAFFHTNGFECLGKNKNNFVLITDTLFNPKKAYYKAEFTTPIISRNSSSNFYKLNNSYYMYNHLLPYVYKITDKTFKPTYQLSLDSYRFPTIDFLKRETKGKSDYTKLIDKHDFISSYGLYETKDFLWIPFHKGNMPPCTGFYDKKEKKGYILSLVDYFKSIGLGVLPFAKGNTDEYIICEIKFDEDQKAKINKNKILKEAIENKSSDDNPILCLIKAKQE